VPHREGRDGDAVLAAARSGEIDALVVGGVSMDDLSDPAAAEAALDAAGFVVSLELRDTAVTARADVVLPIAPVAEKSGSFVTWEGRVRPFGKVLGESNALPDVRVLAGIADQLGRPLGFSTPQGAAAELDELGPWDGTRVDADLDALVAAAPADSGSGLRLATWKTMVSDGPMQDGDAAYHASGPRPVAVLDERTLSTLGVAEGEPVTLSTESGSVTLPAVVGDVDEGVVWAPASSGGVHLGRDLGVRSGGRVTVRPAPTPAAAPPAHASQEGR
jgi:NADH-quinone oxidoreductase subunit G